MTVKRTKKRLNKKIFQRLNLFLFFFAWIKFLLSALHYASDYVET